MDDVFSRSPRPQSGRPRVQHPLHGVGEVQSWRRGGRAAVVAFDSRPLPLEIPARELTPLSGAAEAAPSPAPAAPARYQGSRERDVAALTLEAMRLGVVPSADLAAYTVGRDAEMALCDDDLAHVGSGGGAVRAWFGDYGTGKTHLLELMQQRALSQGFLTSHILLDQEETSPAHPKRVYRSLVRGLRYPDRPFEEGSGLEPLLERAAASPAALDAFAVGRDLAGRSPARRLSEPGFHLYLTPALAAYQALQDPTAPATHRRRSDAADPEAHLQRCRDLLLDWLEGHPTISNRDIDHELGALAGRFGRLYSLLDYRPWARIYGYLVSGIAALARAAGYRGLVVLLDEAEFYALLSRENRDFARGLFIAWSEAATGQPASAPGASVAADDDEVGVGGYGVMRELPAHYRPAPGADASGGFYLALAMTPNDAGESVIAEAVPASRCQTLARFEREHYLHLAERVCDFYASAWPEWRLDAAIVPALGRVLAELLHGHFIDNPRQAMKFVIEFLDVARSQPERVGAVVRGLQSTLLF